MKKSILLISLLSLGTLITLQNCNNSATNYAASDSSACVAPASWFPHSQTPPPEEGNNSPFANPETTVNCDFHQWAFQKFLYLTRTDAIGIANFEKLVQVDNQMNPLGNRLVLSDTTQAGNHTVFHDLKNKPIYYAIYANQQMFDFINTYVAKFKDSCNTGDKYYQIDTNKLKKLGLDTLTYPVGAFEVKTSWILVSSLPAGDTANYYITNATIFNAHAGIPSMTGPIPSRVALIGMHIVGTVINHPENIWATFEHSNLAPTAVWPANYQTDTIPTTLQDNPDINYLFYKHGLPMDSCSIRNEIGFTGLKPYTYHLTDHGTQPNYVGNLSGAHSRDSINLQNIVSLNKSVRNQLKASGEKGPWANYEYIGAVWIDPLKGKLTPGDGNIGGLTRNNLRGSRANTNLTMETYAQLDWDFPNQNPPPFETGNSVATNTMNCFGCHSTSNFGIDTLKNGTGSLGYNLALSHLFNNRLGLFLKGDTAQKQVHRIIFRPMLKPTNKKGS